MCKSSPLIASHCRRQRRLRATRSCHDSASPCHNQPSESPRDGPTAGRPGSIAPSRRCAGRATGVPISACNIGHRMGLTYFLYTCRNQFAPLEYSLKDQPSAIARPRALHFCEYPLIRPEIPWPVEIDGVIQTDHHAYLGLALGAWLALCRPVRGLAILVRLLRGFPEC